MRDDTADWLAPLTEATKTAGIDTSSLLDGAIVPAGTWLDEPPDGSHSYMMMSGPDGPETGEIDWLTFGRTMRDRLGWSDYPDTPTWPADEVAAHEARRDAIRTCEHCGAENPGGEGHPGPADASVVGIEKARGRHRRLPGG